MWMSAQRCLTTAASTQSARTPLGHINASASLAIKEMANIVKVNTFVNSLLFSFFVAVLQRDSSLPLNPHTRHADIFFSPDPSKHKPPPGKRQARFEPLVSVTTWFQDFFKISCGTMKRTSKFQTTSLRRELR